MDPHTQHSIPERWPGKDPWIIGVMGGGECGSQAEQTAHRVGQLIARRGALLLTGGRGGVMQAAAKGCHEAGGISIGILKGRDRGQSRANAYVDLAIRTGLSEARNWINVCAADALIAISGQWGTLSEIALAMKIGKPVVLLDSWSLATREGPVQIPTARTPEQAVDKALGEIRRTSFE